MRRSASRPGANRARARSTTATGFFGLFALFFVNSQYLQDLKGFGAALTGVAILPLPIGMAVAQRLATRWADHPRAVIGTGLTHRVRYRPVMPALTLGVVTSLPAHQAGLGTTARETGAALGVAVTGTVLSAHTDLLHGMGPTLRAVAVAVVLRTTVLVIAGYGKRPTIDMRLRRGARTTAANRHPATASRPYGR
ncbi:hypothetical protein AB5J72_30335 [Streptomyces sp. CG1]|uniref:hypothetical protein n=1 Tax=Streptomyces sp. CG1 TaxID=1287523 RepID=UPI0034E2C36B